ncbi:hypothetical protein AAW00_11720 [Aurantiacibacter luteus]|uniref:Uncharacterized protein n=1 Tax=Aurantiacibacter luteus TaxID=1581420 RepID=A0A0G9MTA7_9SPHN|nr:hypothetical protein AAW00_11720 [Aurantiacibacter luteus]
MLAGSRDLLLLPHRGRTRSIFTEGERPRQWSCSSPARDGFYKSLPTRFAESAEIRYASHRHGYQASNRAAMRFARDWDAFVRERILEA